MTDRKPTLGETFAATTTEPLQARRESLTLGLAEALDAVERFIRRFVVLSDAQAVAVSLWVLHTWAIDAATVAAYIHVHSPEKRSGKTTLLEVLSFLVREPIVAANMSPAVLFRVVDTRSATVLLDEVDTIFTAKTERAELRGLLNAGYRRGSGGAWRIETTGKKHEPRSFDVFGPKALAGIGKLPDTTGDRTIPIELTRKGRDAHIERWRIRGKHEETEPLREAVASWSETAVSSLADDWPALPEQLNDREQDVWEPLLAIADAAAGDWPRRARTAAVQLHAGGEEPSVGTLLLAHVRAAFDESQSDRLSSEELVRTLAENEEGPWPRWWNVDTDGGLRSAKSKLAKLLRPFGVQPTAVRIGPATPRGYLRSGFDDAWAKYLPPDDATSTTSTTPQVAPTSTVAEVAGVADREQIQRDAGEVPELDEDAALRLVLEVLGDETDTGEAAR